MIIKKSLSYLLLLSLLMISVIPFARADFALSTEKPIGTICTGSTLLFPVTVTGAGSFTLNLEGGGAGWSVVVPSGFSSSGSKIAYVYVSPGSRVLGGSYELNVVVNDGMNIKKLPLRVGVEDCATFELNPVVKDQEQFICACESGRYRYLLKNTGAYRESYRLRVESEIASWLTLSQSILNLNPGEEKEVYVAVNPACGKFGQRGFTLNVVSSSGGSASVETSVQIENCFDYEMETEKDFVDMCEHSYEKLKIQFQNTAVRANTYELQLLGPAWADLERSLVFLGVGNTGEVQLLLNPDYGVEGEYAITLRAKGQKGGEEKVKNLQVNVRKCHGFQLDVVDAQARVCQGVSKGFLAKVVNTGEVEKEIRIEQPHPWVELGEETMRLKAGESKEVLLRVESGNLSAGRYELKLRAAALDDSGLEAEDSMQLEVVGRKECYNAEVSVGDARVMREGSATLPLTIRNYGVETGVYEVGVSGNAASFIQINPAVVEIPSGSSEIIYAYLAPSRLVALGEYQLQVHVKNKQSGIITSKPFTVEVVEVVEGAAPGTSGIPGVTGGVVQEPAELPWWQRLSNWFDNLAGGTITTPVQNVTPTLLETPPTSTLSTSATSSTTSIPDTSTTTSSTTTSSSTTTTLASGFEEVDIRYTPVVSEDAQFKINNETHTLHISEVGKGQVTLIIQSEPQIVVVQLNESKEIDVNGDGTMDVRVELQGIENGTPSLQLSEIAQQPAPVVLSYRNYFIVGIVIVVLLILIGIFAFKSEEDDDGQMKKEQEADEGEDEDEEERVVEKKQVKKPEHIEELEEEGEKIPVGRYVLLAIVLAVAVWLSFRYRLWGDVGIYKYYIILGVVVVVLLILVIRYWSSIVEFFEEDIEEPGEAGKAAEKEAEVEKTHAPKEKEVKKPAEKKPAKKARKK